MTIKIKLPDQINKMRAAGKLAAEVLEMITPFVQEGVTTSELDKRIHDYIIYKQDAIPATLGYQVGDMIYNHSSCISVNHVVCHGIPGSKKLQSGDIVNIDVTVKKNGFHGDTSKMFLIGKASIMADRLVKVTHECLWAGIDVVRPGAHFGDIGYAIRKVAKREKFSIVDSFCGHGIGEDFHEEPQVMHDSAKGTGPIIQAGMAFTIEPMINVGKKHVKILPDGWTAITKDRSLSAQWEHTLIVTQDGCEITTLRHEEK